jgi:hypothetical protein
MGVVNRVWFFALIGIFFLLNGCSKSNETPTEVVVYYLTCAADYDRWIESNDLIEALDARKTVIKFSDAKYLNKTVRVFLSKRNWKKLEYPRIDIRVLLTVKYKSGQIRNISLDSQGNFMHEGNIYGPIPELNDVICEFVDGIDCFCKDDMPWLEKAD